MSADQATTVRAVVFDLWKTLVPLPDSVKQRAFIETCHALGVAPQELRGPWQAGRVTRETTPLTDYLAALRVSLGAGWSRAQAAEAMRVRRKNHGAGFADLSPGAVEVLSSLRQAGLRTGLVSNCSSDVRDMLDESALGDQFEVQVLSAEVGLMKPDPQIFRLAAQRLGVDCSQCLYVGDGNDNELAGAAESGMQAVLLDLGEGREWSGARITSLSDLLQLAIPS
ncbi:MULTISPECIES: HAD family hydrolase [Streptomyces]|uniref:HAD family hydrolase n=1 Tax=Streptomyces TaxID=1883 RepID=UPI0036C506D2